MNAYFLAREISKWTNVKFIVVPVHNVLVTVAPCIDIFNIVFFIKITQITVNLLHRNSVINFFLGNSRKLLYFFAKYGSSFWRFNNYVVKINDLVILFLVDDLQGDLDHSKIVFYSAGRSAGIKLYINKSCHKYLRNVYSIMLKTH